MIDSSALPKRKAIKSNRSNSNSMQNQKWLLRYVFRAGGFPSTFSLVYPIVHQRELRPSIVAEKATEKTKNRPAGPNHRRRQGQSQVEPQVNPPSESTSETTSRASSGLSDLVWWFTKSGLVWASLLVHWVYNLCMIVTNKIQKHGKGQPWQRRHFALPFICWWCNS